MRRARVLREQVGKTLFEVALETRIHPSQISRLETGERQPGYQVLKQLAEFYGVTIDELIEDVAPATRAR